MKYLRLSLPRARYPPAPLREAPQRASRRM